MKRPDGFAINGEVYPSYSIRTEIVMHKYIRELEAALEVRREEANRKHAYQLELEAQNAKLREKLAQCADDFAKW
jgi:hypothetical protein